MTITARYAAACPCCAVPIRVGDEIEWAKGRPAMHSRCAGRAPAARLASPPPIAPARSSVSTGKRTGCSCGSRADAWGDLIPSPRNCFSCRHDA